MNAHSNMRIYIYIHNVYVYVYTENMYVMIIVLLLSNLQRSCKDKMDL